jgi:hypothetical protein
MTSADLHPELRRLIELRLESIDLVLAGAQVSWSERRSIVGEVETQIYELLARRGSDPNHDDVMAVLNSLDPAESYAAQDRTFAPEASPAGASAAFAPGGASEQRRRQRLDILYLPRSAARLIARVTPAAAAAVALIVVNGIVLAIVISTQGVIPWLVTLSGIVWLNYRGVRWLRAWLAAHGGISLDDLRYSLGAWLMGKPAAQPG